MRVAIVGAGLIAHAHAQAVKSLGHHLELIISRTEDKAASFAKQWSIPSYSSHFEDILAEDIDSVHICTPPALHYNMIKSALNANKHIICEKPMVLKVEEAKALSTLVKRKNRVGAVNFNVRFHEACQRAKAFIEAPEFGEVRLIHGSYLQEFHALPEEYGWRYQKDLAGDMRATTEIGSHWIDLARYWTGLEIQAVSANFANFNPDRYLSENKMYPEARAQTQHIRVDSEDVACINFRYSNGAVGMVLLSEISHGRGNQLRLEVTGSQQSVWWVNEDPYTLHTSEGKYFGVRAVKNPFGGGFDSTINALIQAVYAVIEGKTPLAEANFPTFEDGYRNTLVCAAIYESAINDGKWVSIRF